MVWRILNFTLCLPHAGWVCSGCGQEKTPLINGLCSDCQ